MDPDAALTLARAALASYDAAEDFSDSKAIAADEVVLAFRALDGWLTKDGFLPKDWQPRHEKLKALAAQRLVDGGYANPI